MLFNINDISVLTYNSVKQNYDEGVRDFQFNIDSYGGDFTVALKIYDLLRSDPECKVSANVDGCCMSAATILLLTAPLENRTATQHSVFMCHSPLLPYAENVNLESAKQLEATIQSAYNELVDIYNDRTNAGSIIIEYMKSEREFYASEAQKLGFVNQINKLYNSNTKMSKIRNLINSIISQLKNEQFTTKDGIQFEAMSLEVGVPVNLPDGVYEIDPTGEVITAEQGIIVDVIPPVEEPVTEPEAVKNEEVVETPVEEKKDDVVETVEQVVEEVTEAVSEEEIKEIVEEAIAELKLELENKYQPMCAIVHDLGGLERLKALKNAKGETKNFTSEKPSSENKSLESLMNKIRKR